MAQLYKNETLHGANVMVGTFTKSYQLPQDISHTKNDIPLLSPGCSHLNQFTAADRKLYNTTAPTTFIATVHSWHYQHWHSQAPTCKLTADYEMTGQAH